MEADRNFNKGGRSFYFFDFDDNIAVLATPVYIFHRTTGKELALTSQQFAEIHSQIGKPGPFADYQVDLDDHKGTFRNFRDQDLSLLERLLGKKQFFIRDLMAALGHPEYHWQGPSWSCFYHAVYNSRPISLITARGHHPETLKKGFRLMMKKGILPQEPNYLSLFPVSHPEVRAQLGMDINQSIAELKQAAIRASFFAAIEKYGNNPYHRFGMSDDDPKNLDLIIEEMTRLKREYKYMSFFVISTHKGQFIKREVFSDHTTDHIVSRHEQLALF